MSDRKFAVEHENVRGAWVQSSQNQKEYVLGRVGFNDKDLKKYAIKKANAVSEVHVDGSIFQQQVGALEFPGNKGINGYVVGLVVESCWTDGTNGWWCIGKELSLGTKQTKVEVKTEGSRGMHVSDYSKVSSDLTIDIHVIVATACVLHSQLGVR